MSLLHPQNAEDKMAQAFGCLVIGFVLAVIIGIAVLVRLF